MLLFEFLTEMVINTRRRNQMIPDQLKKSLEESGLTKERAAELCRDEDPTIKREHISAWVSGAANPSKKKLEVFARALGRHWKLLEDK